MSRHSQGLRHGWIAYGDSEVEWRAEIYPAEPDVGIFSPWVEDMEIREPGKDWTFAPDELHPRIEEEALSQDPLSQGPWDE